MGATIGQNPAYQPKACRRSRLIMGMPGGRIALAIRGGRRPRAGGGEAPKRRCFSSFQLGDKRDGGGSRCLCPDLRGRPSGIPGQKWAKPRPCGLMIEVGVKVIHNLALVLKYGFSDVLRVFGDFSSY